jgi:hypothetical protein
MHRRANWQPISLRVLALLLAAVPTAWAGPETTTVLQNRLKAAVVSKLPQFVEWPAESLEGRASLNICVWPPTPFVADLQVLVAGETFNGRPLATRRVAAVEDLADCQLLFLPARLDAGAHAFLLAAQSLPILTVGDAPGFLEDGGIVALRVVESRVRFDINIEAGRRAGLHISSQLLRLAVSVRGATP